MKDSTKNYWKFARVQDMTRKDLFLYGIIGILLGGAMNFVNEIVGGGIQLVGWFYLVLALIRTFKKQP